MLASRQVLGSIARGRAVGGAASSVRRLATVSDSALDRKVGRSTCLVDSYLSAWGFALTLFPRAGPPEQLGGEQLHQLQEDV